MHKLMSYSSLKIIHDYLIVFMRFIFFYFLIVTDVPHYQVRFRMVAQDQPINVDLCVFNLLFAVQKWICW